MEPQTAIDVQRILDRKRKRAEYDKQRKLKRKIDLTCDKYKSSLRHIHEPVLLSLKLKGIRLLLYSVFPSFFSVAYISSWNFTSRCFNVAVMYHLAVCSPCGHTNLRVMRQCTQSTENNRTRFNTPFCITGFSLGL
jgi:hypothetical protein